MSPCVDLTLIKKVELIKDYEQHLSQRDLAVKYNISTGAIEIIQRLRLFSVTQYPQPHQAITDIESKLMDIYLDSKMPVQSTLDSYFKKP